MNKAHQEIFSKQKSKYNLYHYYDLKSRSKNQAPESEGLLLN